MRTIKIIWTFYKKLVIPALAVSFLTGVLSAGTNARALLHTTGLSYLVFGLLFHFIIYEIRKPREYYFYYNLGWRRLSLWLSTFILDLVIGLTFILC